ncbi:MAG TPA: aspartate kinase [Pyrodictium sp.]|nr:aspartate kinase [Pyrodictium sp.]
MVKPIVMKFGGSILANGYGYVKAAEKVVECVKRAPVIVVVSAMKGVTDTLLQIVSERGASLEEAIGELHLKHMRALEEAVKSKAIFEESFREISLLFNELTKILWAIRFTGTLTPKLRDYVLSFGERFSAKIMEAVLKDRGVNALMLTGGEAGIITNDRFGEASPIMEITEKLVKERIGRLIENGVVPVVTGFIGETMQGEITTLGRGGSDYTASLLAAILDAGELRFYTDVPGIMTGDPKLIPTAKTVPKICFVEALELARAGGKKFHPRTFEPLIDSNVKTIITDLEESACTVVDRKCVEGPKTVSPIRGLALINIEGGYMAGRIGTLAVIANAAKEASVNVVSIFQPATETRISILVSRGDVIRFKEELEKVFSRENLPLKVDVVDDVATLVVVGYNIVGYVERILNVVRGEGCNVFGVAIGLQGSSLTIVVDDNCIFKAVRAVHDELVLPFILSKKER